MSLLSQAIASHQNNNFKEAINNYKKFLSINPNDSNTHQLLGIAYYNLNQLESAKLSFQDSLRLNKNQPDVMSNLANCQIQLGNYVVAIKCLEDAISLGSGNIDLFNELGKTYCVLGDYKKAIGSLNRGLLIYPESTKLLNQKIIALKEDSQYLQAIQILESMLEINPKSINLRHNLGVILRLSGQSERSIKEYNILIKKGVKLHQLMHNMGNALSDLSQFSEAVVYFRKAIQLNIAYVDSHINLNNILWELGREKEFLSSFRNALIAEPKHEELNFAYIKMLLQVSRYEEAFKCLNQIDNSCRQFATYYQLLGLTLVRLGRKKEALEFQKNCLTFHPVNEQHQIDYARNLIETGSTEQAISILEKIIEHNSNSQMAIAYLSSCWRIIGNKKHLEINNYDEVIKEYNLNTIGGKDILNYCDELKHYLKKFHIAKNHPLEQTLIGGSQTKGNLFNDKNELIDQLINEINECIFRYCSDIKSNRLLDLDLKRTKKFLFTGSYSIMLSNMGYHVSHVHPMARLSLCFYVDVPDSIKGDNDNQGCLHIGAPNLDITPSLPAERFIEPSVGKLVIMPSYIWHGTVPFESETNRLTIVCDVKPDY